MNYSKKYLFVIFFCTLSLVSVAQSRSGNIYEFLDMPTTSHATAIGGQHAVLGTDDTGFFFQNPAIPADSIGDMISLNVTPMPAGIIYGSAAYRRHVEQLKGVASVGVQYINYGSFDWTDENGEELGTINAQDVAIYLSYSKTFSQRYTMAATLKPIFSRIHEYSSVGLAMDMGAFMRSVSGRFCAGIVLRNLGSQIKRYDADEHDENLDTDLSLGFSVMPEHAPFRFTATIKDVFHWDLSPSRQHEISKGDNLMRHLLLGLEFTPSESFYIGMGYNQRVRKENRDSQTGGTAGFSVGFGFRVAKIDISYARAKYHLAGSSNSITLSTNLSRFLHGR